MRAEKKERLLAAAAEEARELKTGMSGSEPEAPAEEPKGRKKGRGGKKAKKEEPLGRALLRLFIKLAFIAALLFILLTWVGGVHICHNNDMYPAVRDGDLCITYKLGEYHTGDVIAYDYDGFTCFGRVVAEGGDVVEIDEQGNFYLNGLLQIETVYYPTYPHEGSGITYPYTVPEGKLFVLCDMREQGFDSRDFGAVEEPKGKVVLQLRRRGF